MCRKFLDMGSSFIWDSEFKNHPDSSKVKGHIWVIELYTSSVNKQAGAPVRRLPVIIITPMKIQTFSFLGCPLFLCASIYLLVPKIAQILSLLVSSHLGHQLSVFKLTKVQSHFPVRFFSFTHLSFLYCLPTVHGDSTNPETWVSSGISHGVLDPFHHPSQSGFLLKCTGPASKTFLFSWINHFLRPCSLF